jgi:hypothetical protein
MTKNTAYRTAVGVALAGTLLLIWINGAVGIIGDGPVNVLYLLVVAIGIFGTLVARFHPVGMVRVLIAMAIAQMSVPVIALIWDQPFQPGVPQVFCLNAIFAMMFVGSALLFREAARGSAERRGL